MKISNNKVVELIYTLVVDGKVADQTTEERPLDFIFGAGTLLPKFEENLLDKEANDQFEFVLSAADGYGEYNPEAVMELPKHIFERDGKIEEGLLVVGNKIRMMDNMGRPMLGKVTELRQDSIMMDFNSEMAGKELHFSGKILTVRDATDKELIEGLHGELMHSCGGSCSSCGGGCQ